jgi:hypothetical protein
MAIHAGLRGWEAGEGGILHRRVAITAIDAVSRDMALVAELDRLLAPNVGVGHPGRAIDFGREGEESGDYEHGAKNTDA